MNKKGQLQVLILIGGLVALVIAGGAYYLGRQTTPKPTPTPVVTPTSQSIPSPSPTNEIANWKTYTNTTYGFGVKYPDGWRVVEDNIHLMNVEFSKSKTLIAFFFHQPTPNVPVIIKPSDLIKSAYIKVGNDAVKFDYALTTITKQMSAYSNYKDLSNQSSKLKNAVDQIYFYIGDNTQDNDQINKILSTFKFLP